VSSSAISLRDGPFLASARVRLLREGKASMSVGPAFERGRDRGQKGRPGRPHWHPEAYVVASQAAETEQRRRRPTTSKGGETGPLRQSTGSAAEPAGRRNADGKPCRLIRRRDLRHGPSKETRQRPPASREGRRAQLIAAAPQRLARPLSLGSRAAPGVCARRASDGGILAEVALVEPARSRKRRRE
jgi:hypothetical protein